MDGRVARGNDGGCRRGSGNGGGRGNLEGGDTFGLPRYVLTFLRHMEVHKEYLKWNIVEGSHKLTLTLTWNFRKEKESLWGKLTKSLKSIGGTSGGRLSGDAASSPATRVELESAASKMPRDLTRFLDGKGVTGGGGSNLDAGSNGGGGGRSRDGDILSAVTANDGWTASQRHAQRRRQQQQAARQHWTSTSAAQGGRDGATSLQSIHYQQPQQQQQQQHQSCLQRPLSRRYYSSPTGSSPAVYTGPAADPRTRENGSAYRRSRSYNYYNNDNGREVSADYYNDSSRTDFRHAQSYHALPSSFSATGERAIASGNAAGIWDEGRRSSRSSGGRRSPYSSSSTAAITKRCYPPPDAISFNQQPTSRRSTTTSPFHASWPSTSFDATSSVDDRVDDDGRDVTLTSSSPPDASPQSPWSVCRTERYDGSTNQSHAGGGEGGVAGAGGGRGGGGGNIATGGRDGKEWERSADSREWGRSADGRWSGSERGRDSRDDGLPYIMASQVRGRDRKPKGGHVTPSDERCSEAGERAISAATKTLSAGGDCHDKYQEREASRIGAIIRPDSASDSFSSATISNSATATATDCVGSSSMRQISAERCSNATDVCNNGAWQEMLDEQTHYEKAIVAFNTLQITDMTDFMPDAGLDDVIMTEDKMRVTNDEYRTDLDDLNDDHMDDIGPWSTSPTPPAPSQPTNPDGGRSNSATNNNQDSGGYISMTRERLRTEHVPNQDYLSLQQLRDQSYRSGLYTRPADIPFRSSDELRMMSREYNTSESSAFRSRLYRSGEELGPVITPVRGEILSSTAASVLAADKLVENPSVIELRRSSMKQLEAGRDQLVNSMQRLQCKAQDVALDLTTADSTETSGLRSTSSEPKYGQAVITKQITVCAASVFQASTSSVVAVCTVVTTAPRALSITTPAAGASAVIAAELAVNSTVLRCLDSCDKILFRHSTTL